MYKKKNEKFIKYYGILKEFIKNTKEFDFGNGFLPQKYTEGLCRTLLDLEESQGKDFDAIKVVDSEKKETVEIKATLTKKGTTTLNIDKEFDWLYWMYFNFDNNELTIYEIEGKKLRDLYKENKDGTGRINITLSDYKKGADWKVYDLNTNTPKKK